MTLAIDLTGHVCIVGGSRGIGAAAAARCAEAGADVSVIYRSADAQAEVVCAKVREQGRRTCKVQADMADREQLTAAIDRAAEELGPIRGLVVSASLLEVGDILTVTPEQWDRSLRVNVDGTLWCIRAAVPHMGEGASIVIYTSTAGQNGGGGGPYPVTKAAQITVMRWAAQDLASRGIRVNCIAPAWTDTDMAHSHPAFDKQRVEKGFPLGRIGQPDDVATATCYLLSDLAGFVTGSTHTVDGGAAMKG